MKTGRLLTRPDEALAALVSARTVAVLGAHVRPEKPAHYVPAFLAAQGYRVVGVNPAFVGQPLFGHPVVESLAKLNGQEVVDLVDVFRSPPHLPGHLDDVLALSPLPRVVWLQQGIVHDGFANALVARGVDVVQDRCTLADLKAARVPARQGSR